ncbi:MAG: hypothetical protein IPK82_03760 [Polyangiaceae bacterium]|nr:hypothetical protein [Polyangiaceae bacterium]
MVAVKVGAAVIGDDFFNREAEQRRLWQHFETDHVLLLAPRRVGKTSLMLKLSDDAADKGFLAAYVTVESATDEMGFVMKLLDGARSLDKSKSWLKSLANLASGAQKAVRNAVRKGGPVEFRDPTAEPWGTLGQKVATELHKLAAKNNKRLLLLVDEVPVFVLQLLKLDPSGDRARTFLHWFRELRQTPEFIGTVRWLVTGSIGLDNIARRMGLTRTINDFYMFNDLGAFTEEHARTFLGVLSESVNLPMDEPTMKRFLERVGWLIPFHLQVLFSALLDERGQGKAMAPELVDVVYKRLVDRGHYFDHWVERQREELQAPDDQHAIHLLTAAARPPEGALHSTLEVVLGHQIADVDARDQKLRYLLDVLQSDGYLVTAEGRYRFRSPMLRDFWLHRSGSANPSGSNGAERAKR